jgi:hypothetical protein
MELGNGSMELGIGSLKLGNSSMKLGVGSMELGVGSLKLDTHSFTFGLAFDPACNLSVFVIDHICFVFEIASKNLIALISHDG